MRCEFPYGGDFVARIALFFFTGKKNQKPRRSKNSLLLSSIRLEFLFAVSPVCISLAPLFGFMAKKRSSWRLRQFRATGFTPFRNDFFLAYLLLPFIERHDLTLSN